MKFTPLLFTLSFLVLSIVSCKSEEEIQNDKKEEIKLEIADIDPNSSRQISAPTRSHPAVDSIKVLNEINRAVLPFNGRFFSSISWYDQLGYNIFILSEKGAYKDGKGRKEIFAYHYLQRDSVFDLLWQMNDFVDGWGCDLSIQLINYFPLLSDIDSNGLAETAIFYSLDNRCDAVPFPAKLIVHEGAEKFAIRGIRNQFLGPPEAINNQYREQDGLPPIKYKNLDSKDAKLDSSIISYYAHQWDDFIAIENKLEGALPDSLIKTID